MRTFTLIFFILSFKSIDLYGQIDDSTYMESWNLERVIDKVTNEIFNDFEVILSFHNYDCVTIKSTCYKYDGFYSVDQLNKAIKLYNVIEDQASCEENKDLTFLNSLKNGFFIINDNSEFLIVNSSGLTFEFIRTKDEGDLICMDKCSLEPKVGVCRASLTRFYFDSKTQKCLPFSWGGCGGIVPFLTLEECNNLCGNS